MRTAHPWLTTCLLAIAVFVAVNALVLGFCDKTVARYIDTVGRYIHAL